MDKSRLDDGTVLVAFELPAAVAATSVSLCGDFNDWSPDAHPMVLLDDGRFRTEVRLPAGSRWRFRYRLDGERWENDWAADEYVPNGMGTDDSVVDLTRFTADASPVTGGVSGPSATSEGSEPSEVLEPVEVAASVAEATDQEPAESAPKRRWWRFWERRQLTPA